jgi:integrase
MAKRVTAQNLAKARARRAELIAELEAPASGKRVKPPRTHREAHPPGAPEAIKDEPRAKPKREKKEKRQPIWTALQFEALKPEAEAYPVHDRDTKGLWVYVSPKGTKSWVWFFQWNKKTAKLTIGEKSLAEARTAAAAARVDLAQGIDPRETKKVAKAIRGQGKGKAPAADPDAPATSAAPAKGEAQTPTADSVEAVVASYIKANTNRTVSESARVLAKDVVSRFAGRPFANITTDEWQSAIDAVGERAIISGNRLHSVASALNKWAASPRVRLIPVNNFAGVQRPLKSERKRARERALDDAELAIVLKAADGLGYPYAAIFRLLALTGQRKSEVASMSWDELDLDKALWSLPGERTKNGKAHTVPLPPSAVKILRGLDHFQRRPGQRDHVFGAISPPRSFSAVKTKLDAEIKRLHGKPIKPYVIHDLRRTLVSGLARLGVAMHVVEKIVNHSSHSFRGIVSVYQRYTFEPEMREALNKWDEHVSKIVSENASKIAEPETV